MAADDDRREGRTKEGVSAAVGVGVTLASGAGPMLAALSAVPALASLAIGRVMGRDNIRAQRLFKLMVEGSEDPEAFVRELNRQVAEDGEQVLAALRHLLYAALDAVGPRPMEAIAIIGRYYLRDQCPAWIARGIVHVFSEVTSDDLDVLRQIADLGAEQSNADAGVTVTLSMAGPQQDVFRSAAGAAFGEGVATRITTLLRTNGLARDHVYRAHGVTVLNGQQFHLPPSVVHFLDLALPRMVPSDAPPTSPKERVR